MLLRSNATKRWREERASSWVVCGNTKKGLFSRSTPLLLAKFQGLRLNFSLHFLAKASCCEAYLWLRSTVMDWPYSVSTSRCAAAKIICLLGNTILAALHKVSFFSASLKGTWDCFPLKKIEVGMKLLNVKMYEVKDDTFRLLVKKKTEERQTNGTLPRLSCKAVQFDHLISFVSKPRRYRKIRRN